MNKDLSQLKDDVESSQKAISSFFYGALASGQEVSNLLGEYIKQLKMLPADELRGLADDITKAEKTHYQLQETVSKVKAVAAMQGAASLPVDQAKKTYESIKNTADQLTVTNETIGKINDKVLAHSLMKKEAVPAGVTPEQLQTKADHLNSELTSFYKAVKELKKSLKHAQVLPEKEEKKTEEKPSSTPSLGK